MSRFELMTAVFDLARHDMQYICETDEAIWRDVETLSNDELETIISEYAE